MIMKKFVLYYIILYTLPLLARAAEYTLIAPIPGLEGVKTATSFTTYLKALFPFLLSVAAVLAFVMIVIGGLFYMTSAGNPAAASSAKDRIKAALIGLLIAVSSYLIINAINPNLLNLDFSGSITPIPSGGGGSGSGGGGGGGGGNSGGGELLTNAQAEEMLKEANIEVTSTGSCHDATKPSCTSLEGIPKVAINNVILAQQKCEVNDCIARVTGGTETGHKTHGAGIAIIDLGLQTDSERIYAQHLKDNASTYGITSICTHPNDSQYRLNCTYNEPVPHLHVEF